MKIARMHHDEPDPEKVIEYMGPIKDFKPYDDERWAEIFPKDKSFVFRFEESTDKKTTDISIIYEQGPVQVRWLNDFQRMLKTDMIVSIIARNMDRFAVEDEVIKRLSKNKRC